MAEFTLYIGNKNYSSWSMRPWLALKHAGVDFEEVLIPLGEVGEGRAELIRPYSPSGKVPALKHGDLILWESLAICEYVAELFPSAQLWPEDRTARALARAVSLEMATSFAELRAALTMNIRRHVPGFVVPVPAQANVNRIQQIWRSSRERFGQGGPFLFGRFSIADAMYAPVVTRFETYAVPVDADTRAYMAAVQALPEMQEWTRAAHAEPYVIEAYEAISDGKA
jgi:glutathione S-transferase